MRIVSLLPSATEIVCALGLEQDLVGLTHECDYPPTVMGKPVVTASVLNNGQTSGQIDRHIRELVHAGSSIYRLDADGLEALHPDLILTQELCEVCAVSYPIVEGAVRRLDGDTQLVSLEPQTLEDVFQTIELVGRITGRERKAEEVVAGLRQRVTAVKHAVDGLRRIPTVCLEWIDPAFAGGHWTPELVALAGGLELLGTPRRPARIVPLQAVTACHPEVVVVMACGFSLERSLEEVRSKTELLSSGAQLWVTDGNSFFSRPGPRLVDSLEILAGILHPEALAAPSRAVAARLA